MARRAKIKVRWNLAAFEDIRRLPGVDERLAQEVDRVLDGTGRAHYAGGVEKGASRSRGYVVTSDLEGAYDNSDHHSLLRAAGGNAA